MRLTVLGGGGAWPTASRGCSGYLVESGGFRLLLDPGFGTLPGLLARCAPGDVDAVLLSHAHGDHCADLVALLRARRMTGRPGPLPVYAPVGAAEAVLALDADMLRDEHVVQPLPEQMRLGPFGVRAAALAHFVPNLGVRLDDGDGVLTYTGDGGGDPAVADLAAGAQVLLAEASYAEEVPEGSRGSLGSARDAGRHAARAGVGTLVLTHLMPDVDPDRATSVAAGEFDGRTLVATPGTVVET